MPKTNFPRTDYVVAGTIALAIEESADYGVRGRPERSLQAAQAELKLLLVGVNRKVPYARRKAPYAIYKVTLQVDVLKES